MASRRDGRHEQDGERLLAAPLRHLAKRPAILPWSSRRPLLVRATSHAAGRIGFHAAASARIDDVCLDHARKPSETAHAVVSLAADAEALDERAVAGLVALLEVVEQRAALRHQLQQAAAGMVVLHVGLEVLGEVGDALREDRDLDLGRAGVAGLVAYSLMSACLRSAVIDIVSPFGLIVEVTRIAEIGSVSPGRPGRDVVQRGLCRKRVAGGDRPR